MEKPLERIDGVLLKFAPFFSVVSAVVLMLWSLLLAKQGEMFRDEPIGETETDEQTDDDEVDSFTSIFCSSLFPLVFVSALCSQVVNLNELKHGLESNSVSNKWSSLDFCVVSLFSFVDCAFFSFFETFLLSNCLRFVCHLSGLGVADWCIKDDDELWTMRSS